MKRKGEQLTPDDRRQTEKEVAVAIKSERVHFLFLTALLAITITAVITLM